MKKMIACLKIIEKKYGTVEQNVTTVIFILMCISIALQIVCRFVLKLSVPWTEELIRYSFIAACFVGMGTVQMMNEHIQVDLLGPRINKLEDPKKRRRITTILEIIRNTVMLIVVGYTGWLCLSQMMMVFQMGQRTPALKIPMWILNAFIVYGFVSTVLHTILRILYSIFDMDDSDGGEKETCI